MVQVLFGTDRTRTKSDEPNRHFGTAGTSDQFHYGVCDVSVPLNHRRGHLERPRTVLFTYELPETVEKHFVLQRIRLLDKERFFREMKVRLDRSERNQALLFVHGFANSFADAARRTAQLAIDLDFRGVPVFYSWPSFGALSGYGADTETIKLARYVLKDFIDAILNDTHAKEIFLVAHSMGNEALTQAFIDLAASADARKRIKELVLIAPDIDARVFRKVIAPKLAMAGAGVTLYAARDDVALKTSKELRRGFPRLGDLSDGIVITDGMETIDATGSDTSFVGHAYFVTNDLFYLVGSGLRARDRYLKPLTHGKGTYWKIVPPT